MPQPVRKSIDGKDLFSVFKFGEQSDTSLYIVTRLKGDPLSFTVVVSRTQAASAKPSDIEAIQEWCQQHPERLPAEGGTIRVNLRA